MQTDDSARWLGIARGAALGAGVLLLALAISSATLRPRLLLGGLALTLGGVALPRLARSYGSLAIAALNSALLLVAVELGATAVLAASELPLVRELVARVSGSPNDLIRHYESLAYYREQPWSERYWNELESALQKRYEPYVVWRSPAYSGSTLQIDERGIRRTPGADCSAGAQRVFVFGGSAVWGWGAPDWGTIPAYLQQELQARGSGPVCVVNFGEQAFVSSQGVIQLLMQLQRGDVPDIVLFYDGVNEVLAASQTRQPSLHQNYEEIARLFRPRSVLVDSLLASSTSRLAAKAMSGWGAARDPAPPSPEGADLAAAIAAAYLVNLDTVAGWAETHGFEHHFFWQPHVLIGDKPLDAEERSIVTGLDWVLPLDDDLRKLFASTHARIEAAARRRERLHDLAHVFDRVESLVWIDTWGHVVPPANQRIARELAQRFLPTR